MPWRILAGRGDQLSWVTPRCSACLPRKRLDALICGTHDPGVLANLGKGALRKKTPRFARRSTAGSPGITRS